MGSPPAPGAAEVAPPRAPRAGRNLPAAIGVGLALGASGDADAQALASDPAIGGAIRGAATIDGALAACDVIGGTAPTRVAAALEAAQARLGAG